MGKYILKRLGYMLVVFLILSLLMYLVYAMIPYDRARAEAENWKQVYKNDPVGFEAKYQELRKELGLDQNVFVRYLGWLGVMPINGQYQGIIQGDFGFSYVYDRPAQDIMVEPMKNTIFINIFATILGLGITIPLGIFCAVHRGGKRDTAVQVATIIGYSIPVFITSILFIWIFAILLGWFPVSGMKTPGSNFTGITKLLDEFKYMALPLIVMTATSLGGMTRYVRSSMIEALSMDCIRTARAKGLREKVVIYSHAWRNALIPIITLVIGWFLGIFSGSIMVENIFGLNGMGRIYINSLTAKDFEVVLLLQMFYVIIGLMGNLIIDILYGFADPRIRVNK
ncbi:MAG: ABC transporter permease [Clostridia bacterium]|nr:ABC transporter permease [Clostridia bacterium]